MMEAGADTEEGLHAGPKPILNCFRIYFFIPTLTKKPCRKTPTGCFYVLKKFLWLSVEEY